MKTTTLKDIRDLFSTPEKFPITVIKTRGEGEYDPTYTQVESEITKGESSHLEVLDNITPRSETWIEFYVQVAAWYYDEKEEKLYLFNAYAPVYVYIESGTTMM